MRGPLEAAPEARSAWSGHRCVVRIASAFEVRQFRWACSRTCCKASAYPSADSGPITSRAYGGSTVANRTVAPASLAKLAATGMACSASAEPSSGTRTVLSGAECLRREYRRYRLLLERERFRPVGRWDACFSLGAHPPRRKGPFQDRERRMAAYLRSRSRRSGILLGSSLRHSWGRLAQAHPYSWRSHLQTGSGSRQHRLRPWDRQSSVLLGRQR